ncbi:4-hydroxyphenylacetate 3-hydroxylase C-terminal domain-containing protein [Parafrankia sp. EAN1pec]|uniref:4-hydroxyphenylacetate 3-hydroxylase C-terminal domain-containing protein n=1 Tax=Parafrankia sp. (strain EAN1pec) TaxID=298653 RepID=UPI00321A01D3
MCDDVFVPWDRVLVYRDTRAALLQWWGTAAYANFVHQAATRFWTKLEFLSGLAILIAKANNTYELPPVQNQIGKILGWLTVARSMVLAAEAPGNPYRGAAGYGSTTRSHPHTGPWPARSTRRSSRRSSSLPVAGSSSSPRPASTYATPRWAA